MSTGTLVALLLAGAPASAAPPVDASRLERWVDDVVAAPEFRHLQRYRDTEPEPEPERPRPASPGAGSPERARPAHVGTQAESRPSFSFPDLSAAAGVLRLLVYAALLAVVVWILVLVLRLFVRPRDNALASVQAPADADEAPADETAADECLRQALAHARAGRYRDAIRVLLMGGLGVVERRGLIRYRKGLTNRDYLRAAGREPALRQALEGIVCAFDEVHFGRRAATAERFEACLAFYRAGIAQP